MGFSHGAVLFRAHEFMKGFIGILGNETKPSDDYKTQNIMSGEMAWEKGYFSLPTLYL